MDPLVPNFDIEKFNRSVDRLQRMMDAYTKSVLKSMTTNKSKLSAHDLECVATAMFNMKKQLKDVDAVMDTFGDARRKIWAEIDRKLEREEKRRT